jgi:hypothetical protein
VLSLGKQSDALGQLSGGPLLGSFGSRSLRVAFVVSAAPLAPRPWLLPEEAERVGRVKAGEQTNR